MIQLSFKSLHVEAEFTGAAAVVRLSGQLNLSNTPDLKSKSREWIDANGSTSIIFDMSGVDYIDSSGMGMLFFLHKQLTAEGKTFELASPQDAVMRIIELGNFHKVLRITGKK